MSHVYEWEALDDLNAGRYTEARTKYRFLADSGSATACLALAQLYRSGTGGASDEEEARKYYESAISGGLIIANHYLGRMLFSQGKLVEALACVEVAAGAHYLPSVYWAGTMYLRGEGATRDLDKANLYLASAAGFGHIFALRDLAACHIRGVFGKRRILFGLGMLLKSYIFGLILIITDQSSERLQ